MDDLHNIFDTFFVHLENTGSISNSNLMKLVTMSLINDYGLEMVSCNKSYGKILDDMINGFINSSCLFDISNFNLPYYSIIGDSGGGEIVTSGDFNDDFNDDFLI